MSRRKLFFFILPLIIAIILLSLSERTKLVITSHVSSVVLYPLRSVFRYVQYLGIAEKKIHTLETQIQELRLRNTELRTHIMTDSVTFENVPYEFIKAHIIGRDPTNINGYLYVDQGRIHGVELDQPTLTIDGLVGRIHYVAENYSIVETIEHEGFAVSAIDLHTGIHGIVRKNTFLLFDFIRMDDSIYIHDSICTSGMSEIFPAGVLIGQVHEIAQPHGPFFKPVYINPAVKINRLVYVYILIGYRAHDIDLNIRDGYYQTEPL